MRTRNYFKYLLAAIVAIGTSVNVMADEATYKFNYESTIVELQTIQAPVGTSVKLRGSDFTRASNTFSFLSDNYRDRVYLPNGQDEYIDFTNFRYEVTEVKMYVMANPNLFNVLESNIYANLRDYKGVDQNNSFRIGVLQGNGLDFHEVNFINTAIAPASGLKLLYLKGNSSGNPAFFRGSNNATSPTFKVIYNKPDVRIRFANGKKGYDIGIGESNAEIEGYISDHAGAFVVGQNNLHFEYESSDNSIATFANKTSGKITALSEGDVTITAKLMEGNNEISSYSYTLHVFGKDEGLEWQREEMFRNGQKSGNPNEWTIGNTANSNNEYDWVSSDYLKVNTTIWENSTLYQSGSSRDNWKQVVSLTTPVSAKWRAIAQKVAFKMLIPKYTTAEASFNFAANFTIGEKKGNSNKYGYEVVDFGEVSSEEALSSLKNITWNTKNSDEDIRKFSDITILRNGADNYTNFVGSGKNGLGWTCDNKNGEEATSMQRYLAVMAYLHNNHEYPGEVSVGYKNIPTYKYYAYIHYYANYKEVDDYLGKETMFATGKSESINLNRGNVIVVPNRPGYTLLGWSHDKNATMAEYAVHNAFIPYDSENGGGKGNITLYAVWQPKTYNVPLSVNGGYNPGVDDGKSVAVTATWGAPMPSVSSEATGRVPIPVPVKSGFIFGGYYTTQDNDGTMYYDRSLHSVRNWDIDQNNTVLYARWIPEYTVTLDHNDGSGVTEQKKVVFGESMPAITIPTRLGYVFNGYWDSNDYSDYYNNGNKYYDSDAASVRSWDKSSNSTLYAHWKVRAYKVIYHSNDTRNIVEEKNATLSNYQVEYSSAQGWIAGYTFKGWSYSTNGSVDLQQGNNISPDNVNINEETKELHLYAVWKANEYALTLDPQGGTGGTITVTASFGQSMPEIQIPARAGYTFNGYWDSSSNKYYDVDGSSARNWDKSENATLYAHWTPIKYVLTLNAGPNTVIPTTDFGNGTHSYIVSEDRTTITMDVSLEENLGSFYNGVPKKPGFKFVGFYVDDILVASATGDKGRNLEFTNNAYINNSVWKYTGNLTLTARWIPKYTLSDNVLTFNDGEYLEVGIDWQSGKVNDLLGATEYEVQQGHISSDNPVMAFDIRNVIYQDGSSNNAYNLMQGLQNKNYISPNALVYVGSDAYSEYKVNNVIRPLGQGDEAKFNNIVVTDRYPIKIIESFTAQTATYERNKAQKGDENDAMWQQSKESVWGTLCLPYPITNNKEYNESGIDYKIRFYELYGTHDNYMQFREMAENQRIEANTPVLYCRTAGVGSAVTVQESSVGVPANIENGKYKVNPVLYSNELKEEMKRNENAERVVEEDWQFKGTLETKKFCTQSYKDLCNKKGLQSEFLEGAEVVDNREIYYFEKDRFTHMTGGVQVLPYRAYFDRTKIEVSEDDSAESKVSSYSILVVDADGTTTDITNLVDNHEAKGNGKIYDLSGRRVKQPVKGSIYIVDGKKKMY